MGNRPQAPGLIELRLRRSLRCSLEEMDSDEVVNVGRATERSCKVFDHTNFTTTARRRQPRRQWTGRPRRDRLAVCHHPLAVPRNCRPDSRLPVRLDFVIMTTLMDIAKLIDHTCLTPGATAQDIDRLCEEAVHHCFCSVCVAPVWVARAAERVAGSSVRVCSVVGFPHGNTLSVVKGVEAETVLQAGADEIDMVLNIGALRQGAHELVSADIALVAEFVGAKRGGILKVILEVALLNDEQIVKGCQLAEKARADFVKTSTGVGLSGATVEAVRLMRETVGDRLGVKAAGGIRDYEEATTMIDAGANRIGASASVAIVAAAP